MKVGIIHFFPYYACHFDGPLHNYEITMMMAKISARVPKIA
jgi:hypothetical protein